MDLMWFLLLAHLTGDYALQSDRMAAQKGASYSMLTAHVLIYTACVALTLWLYAEFVARYLVGRSVLVIMLGVLFIIHWSQDLIKGRYFGSSKQAYYVDQVLHLAQLYAIRLLIQ